MQYFKISIVLPVFNGERNIEDAIKSITNQNYPNYELIIVDDGSKDKTASIVERYKDNNSIKIIHQNNRGVSAARNQGLKQTTGEFVLFVDADDSMTEKSLEKLNFFLQNHVDTDVAIFKWREIRETIDGKEVDVKTPDIPFALDRNSCIESIIKTNYGCGGGYPWNKIWKRSCILNDDNCIFFNENMVLCEDKEWTIRALLNVNYIYFINDTFYNYTIRDSASLSQIDFDNISDSTNTKIKSFLDASLSIYFVLDSFTGKRTLTEVAKTIMAQDITMVYFKCLKNKNIVLENYVSHLYRENVKGKRIEVGMKYILMQIFIFLKMNFL